MRGRVEDGGIAVGFGERRGQLIGGQALDLLKDVANGVLVHLLEDALAELLLNPEELEEIELDVTDVALVVAHCHLPLLWV